MHDGDDDYSNYGTSDVNDSIRSDYNSRDYNCDDNNSDGSGDDTDEWYNIWLFIVKFVAEDD